TDLFEAATIDRLLGHFEILLEGVVANPEQRLAQLPLLSPAEREQLLAEGNDTACDYPRDTCLHTLLEAQAARTPEAIAVEFKGESLTYRALHDRAEQVAGQL